MPVVGIVVGVVSIAAVGIIIAVVNIVVITAPGIRVGVWIGVVGIRIGVVGIRVGVVGIRVGVWIAVGFRVGVWIAVGIRVGVMNFGAAGFCIWSCWQTDILLANLDSS